jgi:pimeloyl-ACP methyl ester carboxylesterase
VDVRRKRDPDRMFDAGMGLRSQQVRLLDGLTMRTVVAGSGDPLVVFEGGIAVCASMWMTVQRLVAEETRTFAYDRAGCGGSADDPKGRSFQRMADDLAAVLDAADQRAPVVLVGASLGAAILHLFARAHPGRVAGVVLVDAAVGDIVRAPQIRVIKTMFALYSALSRVGLHTPLRRARLRSIKAALPIADQAQLMRDFCAKRTVQMGAQEARELTQFPSLRQLVIDLPEVPVVALVGAQAAGRGEAKGRAAMLNLFRSEMQSHSRGRFVTATGSGHFIPWQEPGLVAEEITRLVRTVRQSSATQD